MARPTSKSSHLELRYQTYYAVLFVPKDVRHVIGKVKFYQSTQTSNLKIARQRATALVLGWQSKIDAARHQAEDPIIASALELREQLTRQSVRHLVKDVINEEESRIREEVGDITADAFKEIATRKQDPLSSLVPSWKKYQVQRGLKQKTIDQMNGDVELMTSWFPTVTSLRQDYVEAWIKQVSAKNSLSPSTSNRILGSCRNFFKYLQDQKVAPKTMTDPFIAPTEFKISNKKNSRAINKSTPWLPLKPSDVIAIHSAAIEGDDQQLADLILIGAYTGARIEELSSLKCSEINLDENSILIVDAKTEAGNRLVPIHPKIKTKMKKMIDASTDGYLFTGLTENKYGDKSNAIGKRFGRLKTKLGYTKSHVFHSIRKTFTTMLEENGISENMAADIVGHEKPRITYGLYSGGASLAAKRKAILKISYNFGSTETKSPPANKTTRRPKK
jgi:integrase